MAYSLALTQAVYVFLFLRDKGALGQYDLVPASINSENLALPKPSVVKILKCLTQAGIVVTGTGVAGGARLAPGARDRTLYDLFLAVEGQRPLFQTQHRIPAQGLRPDLARQAVQRVFGDLEEGLLASMRSIPLGSLVPEEPQAPGGSP